jgi:hypothetical protein
MIISVSRRTDIPSFYTKWFINRINEGFCTVPNPFNKNQVSEISLKSEDVDVIVFWTRNPKPLFPYLDELTERGYRYYFQFTLMDNPRILEKNKPNVDFSIKSFQELAQRIGHEKVIWRYDPIVLSNITNVDFHLEKYEYIASRLSGYTSRSVISIVDNYGKAKRRFKRLEKEQDIQFYDWENNFHLFEEVLSEISQIAERYKMEIVSCAEVFDLDKYGIRHGKCIDDDYIKKVFRIEVSHKKDSGQREACGCVASREIGMYDTCLFGCQYCYATTNFDKARENYRKHNPDSPSLVGWYVKEDKPKVQQDVKLEGEQLELDLFKQSN